MLRKFLFGWVLISSVILANAGTLVGVWSGDLKVQRQMSLKIVFHINEDKTFTLDSPDQGAYGIEGKIVFLSDDSISLKVPKLMMSYTGHRVGDSLEGTFKQQFTKLPLTLTPGEKKALRTQTPVAPFPYATEEVVVAYDDVSLAGTLTIPDKADSSTPVVVLVTGSGQQNRDEELFEHKPFAVIADYLARNGIASLRYDDRGIGGSTGEVSNATTADFAADAEAVINYVRARKQFGKVGLLGHSEGGLIAYKEGAKPGLLDFIVSVAGPVVRGDSILLYQNRNALAKSGITGNIADDFLAALARAFQMKIDGTVTELTDSVFTVIYPTRDDDSVTRQLSQSIRGLFGTMNPWMQHFISYSPSADLKALQIPTLIIYGDKDKQVPASLNAPVARQYAPQAIIKVYPYANHLMQHAESGEIEEYKSIEETISPEVLGEISSFINGL